MLYESKEIKFMTLFLKRKENELKISVSCFFFEFVFQVLFFIVKNELKVKKV